MSYKFGDDKLDHFYSNNFAKVDDLNELREINKFRHLICTINNNNYSRVVKVVNELQIDYLFVIIDSENINVLNIQKEFKNKANKYFFVIKTSDDWFIIRQKVDRTLLGFDAYSDMNYVYVVLLLLVLKFIPVLISIYLKWQ